MGGNVGSQCETIAELPLLQTQGQAGASHRIVLHADPSLPVGAIEVDT